MRKIIFSGVKIMKKNFVVSFFILIFLSSLPLSAQEPYKLPLKEVIDIVDAPPPPRALMSPTGDFMLLADYEVMPSIAYMAQPMLRLAGMRITPKYNSRQQTLF